MQSSRIIDESAEWRSFGADERGGDGKADMNRVGGKTNPYLSNSGLETSISGTNALQYAKWHVKGQYHNMTSKDRSMTTCTQFLKELCDRLNIDENTFNKSVKILKSVEDAGVAKGQRINVKCATILFIACRQTNNQKELKDILTATHCGHKDISKCYKRIKCCMPGA